ncbi:hypothetical protein HG263_13155 [Pseudoalteromonas sp. JBTF-M23]|uniref:Spore coat protein U domain-containing protein n=1 Tax=Pseudoalteromonas caenipelagi TaxID=2726988 RepID=A0A849VFE8_9GAMM|nr:hypothetical protein [Pseudoalteromonas caenipelagi]NOU51478.1 hypothetical protein [Pseudoalteromonas caenipelagi]
MHTLLNSLFIASTIISLHATAAVVDTTSSEAKYSFEGTVEPMCKTSSGSNSVAGLTLDASQTTQEIGTLDVWCNTNDNATTEYSSANGGYLVADNSLGSKLAYTLSVGDKTGIDLQAGTYTHEKATSAGTGDAGETKSTLLKITPLSNGLNESGTYSDTITVTVRAN